ncbi:DMT family transporter [Cronobacter turicensis]|uniref:DMT family transporter n=1 Tax=Cronobacter turicensis TaxID=413502 RepID=UPI0011AC0BB7|nr:DMT family transporter [Cronobacter turicensis]EKY3118464.1 DMT family transporter [Cronobacter turicensis]ELU8454353.1 DMT family transporter [Cronobacter turicensis]ELY4109574.1 DMT family transporter [Cronobacter turicensis]ELY4215936.1 DMT family transporter [Cronobacter turicensis]EMA1790975.1 DMT family transporter [Cronobacter turicensis]
MAYLLLALAAIFWGGNYVVGHILVQYVDPYGLSLIRWGFTTALMLALYWRRFSVDFATLRKHLGINALLSFLGQVSFPLSLYIGLQYTTSLNAAIYISSTPCLVLLINHFVFHERISARNIIGVIASTGGVLYLAFSSAGGSGTIKTFGVGDVLTIISALSWAFYCAFLRLKDKTVKNTSFVAFSSLIGTIILVPMFMLHAALAPDYRGVIYTLSPAVIAGILYLIIFPSWLSYVFWNKGVSLIGTTRSEIYTHLIPVSGGIMGIVFLGNELRSYHIITMLLIVFGIVCCSYRNEPKVSPGVMER